MPIPANFEAYYDCDRKHYWIQDDRGAWVSVNTDALRLKLRCLGASDKKNKTTGVSEIDKYLGELFTSRNVFYAGPVAGHRSGVIEQHGNRILVTNSPTLIIPTPGPWDNFSKMLTQLLGDPEHPQPDYFHGWLLMARRCLISGDFKPGQCLVIAGSPDCGKSFLQNRITKLLGGRAAKPYQFMAHDTTFNRELFGAEHLMIEDVVSSTDIRARRNFGSRIKEFTVNEVQACHGKNRDGVNVNPMWRMTITVNDEPEDLMVLPPMIDSVADKFILLKAGRAEFPPETDAFRMIIDSELPHYLHWLHNEFKIPEAIQGRRYGVKSFQHPELLRSINDLAPEHELLLLINQHCFKHGATLWKGTAGELQAYLSTCCERRVEGLFKWGQACATYLARLHKQFPQRFLSKRTKHERYWEIKPGDDTGDALSDAQKLDVSPVQPLI
jgi:hypothetical protein